MTASAGNTRISRQTDIKEQFSPKVNSCLRQLVLCRNLHFRKPSRNILEINWFYSIVLTGAKNSSDAKKNDDISHGLE